MKKYIVLEHLMMPDKGFRFWTTNSEFACRLLDGRLAYAIILESDDETECAAVSKLGNVPESHELTKHIKEMREKYPNGKEPSVMENLEKGLKTSWLWNLEDDRLVLDPDGWDRKNYEFSWNMELITHEEYLNRVYRSTTAMAKKAKRALI